MALGRVVRLLRARFGRIAVLVVVVDSGANSTLFCFANKGATLKVHILEVVKGTASAPAFQKRAVDIQVRAGHST